ncbi:MAG: HlyD family efflux transporter periplasmic adaptor subunit, partial [Rhodospirillales bacterium]|nr:HlyD family efflux transporter periplasmic adaptor subunit [Rhodospirillales bacterium]
EIKSPIDGVVKNLIYNTIGGVIRSGDTIMEIVPTGDLLVIEARLNPTDRWYVEIGQEALVKISTYDYARYGGLVGHVVSVAPDTSVDDNGEPFFRVIVETDQSYLGNNANELPITPGMQASIDIETGTRSVLEYMIKPVLKLKHESFRER